MTSSPSSFPRFSLLAAIFRTTLNKSHLGDSNNTHKKHLCVVESAFTFPFSPIPQLSLNPCSVKTPQHRVHTCVHKGKPKATNRSRVNPITVQCKVGNCFVQLYQTMLKRRKYARYCFDAKLPAETFYL